MNSSHQTKLTIESTFPNNDNINVYMFKKFRIKILSSMDDDGEKKGEKKIKRFRYLHTQLEYFVIRIEKK